MGSGLDCAPGDVPILSLDGQRSIGYIYPKVAGACGQGVLGAAVVAVGMPLVVHF